MSKLYLNIKDFDLDEEISIRGYLGNGSEYEFRINTQFNQLTNCTANLTSAIQHLILKSDSEESLQHSLCEKTGRDLMSYKFNIYEIILLTSEIYELNNLNKLLNDWFLNKGVVKIAIFWVSLKQKSKEVMITSNYIS
ncbi:hypothetical protein ACT4XR_19840 (plasmid) [Acinetobacter baumannii]|uniref:hypothetical protein n=1 Tax=Acinetobacter baumannii TaxID=470 RepID=UPI00389276DF